jgi:hypothetical protein
MHNVFHVSLLRPYIEGKSTKNPPIPEVIQDEFEFQIQNLMKHRLVQQGKKHIYEYLIRWKGYKAEHDTWEPQDNLENCALILHKYNKEHKLII